MDDQDPHRPVPRPEAVSQGAAASDARRADRPDAARAGGAGLIPQERAPGVMGEAVLYFGLATALLALAVPRLVLRLELSRAKHPSLSGHSRVARRVAALIPFYAYPEERFFRAAMPRPMSPTGAASGSCPPPGPSASATRAPSPRPDKPARGSPTRRSPRPTAVRSQS